MIRRGCRVNAVLSDLGLLEQELAGVHPALGPVVGIRETPEPQELVDGVCADLDPSGCPGELRDNVKMMLQPRPRSEAVATRDDELRRSQRELCSRRLIRYATRMVFRNQRECSIFARPHRISEFLRLPAKLLDARLVG